MRHAQFPILTPRRAVAAAALCACTLAVGPARAGGLMMYEVGTADIGLASAGYGARAQDASTVFTNSAVMTRLDGNQALIGGQLLWSNTKFSIGSGTSAALGGGAFFTYSLSPDLKLGVAMTGNFGSVLKYDENWAGRYYVQEATMIGASILPSIAYKATDKLSLGASVNAMYGIYKNKVAINIPDALRPGVIVPIQRATGDAQLKLEDETWGWGVNLGLLYDPNADTRFGLTWNSQVDLDFSAPTQLSSLGNLGTSLQARGLLNGAVSVGMKVPQQAMASFFTQVNDRGRCSAASAGSNGQDSAKCSLA